MSSGFLVCFGITIFGDEPLRDQEVPCFIWVRDLGHLCVITRKCDCVVIARENYMHGIMYVGTSGMLRLGTITLGIQKMK